MDVQKNRKKAVSIIVPVEHGGTFLQNALLSLAEIKPPQKKWEVIAVFMEGNNSAQRIIHEMMPRFSGNLTALPSMKKNRAGRLNEACSKAEGDILVFGDDDCRFPEDWLAGIEHFFKGKPKAGMVGGRDELVKERSVFDEALDRALHSFVATAGLRQGKGPRLGRYYPRLWNMAVRRKAAEDAALSSRKADIRIFDEDLDVHEDVDLADRIRLAGWHIHFDQDITVLHSRDTSFRSFFRRNVLMGGACRKKGIHTLSHVFLSLFCLAVLFSPAAVLLFPFFRPPVLIAAAFYLFLLLSAGFYALAESKSVRVFLWVPLLVFSLHFARGWGYIFSSRKIGK